MMLKLLITLAYTQREMGIENGREKERKVKRDGQIERGGVTRC